MAPSTYTCSRVRGGAESDDSASSPGGSQGVHGRPIPAELTGIADAGIPPEPISLPATGPVATRPPPAFVMTQVAGDHR